MVSSMDEFVLSRIPHRPPFLWVDRVLEITNDSIRAEKVIPEELDLFAGHYPGHPLMPGVLLCEAVFQAGALLISELMHRQEPGAAQSGVPVLTRILGAKFKREVLPGDTIEISATLTEQLASAWFLKGRIRLHGKLAVQVEFACAQKGG